VGDVCAQSATKGTDDVKTMAGMTNDEIATYLTLLGRATAEVVPPDALFCVVLFGPNGKGHYTSNARRLEIPTALREMASELEKTMAPDN
jgi:hypothetical protein